MFGLPSSNYRILKIRILLKIVLNHLGASIENQKTGIIGKNGIFSFYATKLITSGGQGAECLFRRDKGPG